MWLRDALPRTWGHASSLMLELAHARSELGVRRVVSQGEPILYRSSIALL